MIAQLLLPIGLLILAIIVGIALISRAGEILTAIGKLISLPATVILRAVVIATTLPAAFMMVHAEKDLGRLMGQEVEQSQIEVIRLRMAASVKTSWNKAQVDEKGMLAAYRLARSFA